MGLFNAVAMHGDLRDVPFIKKTLQIEFANPDSYKYHDMDYQARTNNFAIDLSVHDTRAQKSNHWDMYVRTFHLAFSAHLFPYHNLNRHLVANFTMLTIIMLTISYYLEQARTAPKLK